VHRGDEQNPGNGENELSANHTELTFFRAKEIRLTRGFAVGGRKDERDVYYTRQIVIVSADGSEFQITCHSVTGQSELPVIASDEEVV
jgi:hypothetical protein